MSGVNLDGVKSQIQRVIDAAMMAACCLNSGEVENARANLDSAAFALENARKTLD